MTTEETSKMVDKVHNPFIAALGWIAGAGITLSGFAFIIGFSDLQSASGAVALTFAGAIGSLSIGALLLWLHASAMKWERPTGTPIARSGPTNG